MWPSTWVMWPSTWVMILSVLGHVQHCAVPWLEGSTYLRPPGIAGPAQCADHLVKGGCGHIEQETALSLITCAMHKCIGCLLHQCICFSLCPVQALLYEAEAVCITFAQLLVLETAAQQELIPDHILCVLLARQNDMYDSECTVCIHKTAQAILTGQPTVWQARMYTTSSNNGHVSVYTRNTHLTQAGVFGIHGSS